MITERLLLFICTSDLCGKARRPSGLLCPAALVDNLFLEGRIMSITKKMIERGIRIYLRLRGFKNYMARLYAGEITAMFWDDPDGKPLNQKLWALRRGFVAEKIDLYGLTEENYKDFLSDWDYYRMFPLNNQYSKWIDDKLTMKYTLSKYDEYLPEYYCQIDKTGGYNYLMNWPEELPKNGDPAVLCKLLQQKQYLAAKQLAGSAGEGFYKLAYKDGSYYANGIAYDEAGFEDFLIQLKGYLFTEFIVQCTRYEEIYPNTTHTLRVQTLRRNGENARCVFSFIRWGGKNANYSVTHVGDGVTAVVDRQTGMIDYGFYRDEKGRWIHADTHPDTGVSVVGKIPRWEEIVAKCSEIHNYMSELEYLGFDVIITENSFKLCEINSHSGIRGVQHVIPLMKDEICGPYYTSRIC